MNKNLRAYIPTCSNYADLQKKNIVQNLEKTHKQEKKAMRNELLVAPGPPTQRGRDTKEQPATLQMFQNVHFSLFVFSA